jgi:hypothetical protein
MLMDKITNEEIYQMKCAISELLASRSPNDMRPNLSFHQTLRIELRKSGEFKH